MGRDRRGGEQPSESVWCSVEGGSGVMPLTLMEASRPGEQEGPLLLGGSQWLQREGQLLCAASQLAGYLYVLTWFGALGGFSWFSHALVHGLAPRGPAKPPPAL